MLLCTIIIQKINVNNKVMKANEAPEKLYLHPTASGNVGASWLTFPLTSEDIEYTRTDVFIEKALKWYCLDCECNDNCKDTKCFFYRAYECFLQGEDNAIPPKFSDRILNEDGSTSDNWRYRHFIVKMQDAFIEKAENFLEMLGCGFTITDNITHTNYGKEQFIEDFKKALEKDGKV